MNRTELVAAVSEKTGITKADTEKIVKALIETVELSVKKGDPVTLVGFGTFTSIKKAARVGKNPQTGAALKIPAHTVPKFKPGKAFKDVLNAKKK